MSTDPLSSVSPDPDPIIAPVVGDPNDDQPTEINPMLLAAIGLALLAFLPFALSTRGQMLWLDSANLLGNPFVSTSDGIARFWMAADSTGEYEPLTLVSYWLEFRFVHAQPAAYRVVNVLLHVAVVILLWTLLSRLAVPGAWLAAAIFAVHPVHVQAVAWISMRGVLMGTMFYLAAMLVYLRYVGITPVPPGSKTLLTLPSEPQRLWGLALALFICGIASHPIAVTFPIAVVLVMWWKRDRIAMQEWLMLLPFFAVAVAAGIWIGYLQMTTPLRSAVTSAFGPTPLGNQIEYAIRAIAFYGAKTLLPIGLIFDYARFTPSVSELLLSTAVLLIVLAALFLSREKFGRGALTAAVLFVVLILPMLGILDAPAIRYSFVADYRQYLASGALIALVVGGITYFCHRNTPSFRTVGSVVGGLIVAVLFILSARSSANYARPDQIWTDTLKTNKSSLLAADGFGEFLRETGHFKESREWLHNAEKVAPGDPRAKYELAVVDEAEAFDQQHTGHADQAARLRQHAASELEAAIANDRNYGPALIELGDLRASEKDDKSAITAYTDAVAAAPLSIGARLGLAGALRRDNQLDAAEQQLYDVIDMDSDVAAAHTELGNVLLAKQQSQDAVAEWAKAAVLDPRNTTILLNYGGLLASSGQYQLAARQFFAATRLKPNNPLAYIDLGVVDLKMGMNQDAVVQLSRAVELDPSDAHAKQLLSDALQAVKTHGPGTMPSTQPVKIPT